ncbi:MAG: hypothetical protein KGJ06_07310 [Pseudomonadota bacterium]|nr:hypothetical protein [Pseudomonadota bacterium]
MSIYAYPESKIIDEVTFEKSEGGHLRAYLHANTAADADTLHDITCNMAKRSWRTIPCSINGKPLLEVQDIPSEKEFTGILEQAGWAQGQRRHTTTEKDKLSWGELIKKRSLGASGLAYIVGDLSFATYGYKDSNKLNLAAGLLYGAGTASLLVGGRKDPSDLQTRDIAKKIAQHFRAQNIELPEGCSLASITEDHNKGLIKKADDLFRRYPSELMNLFFAAAGVCIAVAAYRSKSKPIANHEVTEVMNRLAKKNPATSFSWGNIRQQMEKNHKREAWLDIGLGGMTAASGLFAMSVPEKARDPDDPPQHGLAAAWEWIRERPLAIAGAGYMVSTLCHAVSTTLAWKYASNDRRKSVPFRALFVAANLVAEVLLAISSKGHGEGVVSDKSVDSSTIAIAADLIVRQPKAMQNALIDYMGNFLGRQDVLAMGNEEAANLLRTQVEAMRSNPWAQPSVSAPAAAQLPAPEPAKEQQPAPWEARLNASRLSPSLSPGL